MRCNICSNVAETSDGIRFDLDYIASDCKSDGKISQENLTEIENSTVDAVSSSSNGLRSRGTASSETTFANTPDSNSSETEDLDLLAQGQVSKVTQKDPARWFGVLTPSSLKTSQSHFRQGIHQHPFLLCNLVSK